MHYFNIVLIFIDCFIFYSLHSLRIQTLKFLKLHILESENTVIIFFKEQF